MRAIVLAGALAAIAVRVAAFPNSTIQPSLGATLDHLPVTFEANVGQAEAAVRFLSHGQKADLYLTPAEVLLALHRAGRGDQRRASLPLRLIFGGANPQTKVEGLLPLDGKANYFLGDDSSRWRVNAPTYSRVQYSNIYPGVDLVFYGTAEQLEYDLVVKPEAKPDMIDLEFDGAQTILIEANGDLLLRLRGDHVRQRKPSIYQEINGQRRTISGGYVLKTAHRAGFQIGAYDHTKPLIIDPVLSYSEIFGVNGGTTATSIAVDIHGNSYVTGNILSPGFFTSNSFQTNLDGYPNAYVTKFDTNGAVVYSTYLGGSYTDYGQGIAVDTNGDAFVTGFTDSTNFPTLNALQSTNSGGYDAFVTELNPAGNKLIYSTYIGGSSDDAANAIALDTQGNPVITGYTESTNFPLANAAQETNAGSGDAFVTKLNANGSALVYSTYLGGTKTENIGAFVSNPLGAVAVDAAGNAYVTGVTYSTNFPVTNAFQKVMSNTIYTAFVTMFSPGGALIHSSFLGGSFFDAGSAIAVDSKGDVYVGGNTESYDFPTKKALQPNYSGYGNLFLGDGFLTVLDPTGTNLIYSTYLGGSGDDIVNGIAVDDKGDVALTGYTSSPDFPLLNPTAGAGNQGFFVSSNGVWQTSAAGLTNGNLHTYFGYFNNYNGNVVAVLVDPSNTSNLYLSAQPAGIFKSTDGGSNWIAANTGLSGFSSIFGLAFDPKATSTIFAWGYDGVSITTNGAANWTNISTGLPGSGFPFVQTLAVDPTTPTTLYAGTEQYGLYKSIDGGNSWDDLPGMTNADLKTLVVDPEHPSTVYAGGNNYSGLNLFQSTNYGANWNLIGASTFTEGPVVALSVNPTNSAIVYAIVQSFFSSVLAVSTDSGSTWSNLLESFDCNFTALAIDSQSPATMYLGTDQNSGLGVLQSTDGGLVWYAYGLNSEHINTLAIDPANDQILYAGVNGGQDAFISTVYTNGALSFSTFLGGTGADTGNGIAIDKQGGVHVAGATDSSDFPGAAVAAMSLSGRPRKLGGPPNPPITQTLAQANDDVGWMAQYLAILGAPPCPPGNFVLIAGSLEYGGNSNYSFAVGATFSATGLISTDFGDEATDSVSVQSGTLPSDLTISPTGISGTFTQPGTYTFNLKAIDDSGCAYTSGPITFVVTNPPPAIASVSPSNGPAGTQITLTGSSFLGVEQVLVNGATASFNINSYNQITFDAPIGTGAGPIELISPSGTTSTTLPFNYTPMNVFSFGNPSIVAIPDTVGNLQLLILNNRYDNSVTSTIHVRTQPLLLNPCLSSTRIDPFNLSRSGLAPMLATSGMDYGPFDMLVTFPPGSNYQYIFFPIFANPTPQPPKFFGVSLYGPSSDGVVGAPWDYTVVSTHNSVPFNPANTSLNLTPYLGGNSDYKLDWSLRMSLRYSFDLGYNWSELPALAPPVIGSIGKRMPAYFSAAFKPTNTGTVSFSVQTRTQPNYLNLYLETGNAGPATPLTNGTTTLTNVPAGTNVPMQVQSFLTVETNSVTGERTTYVVSVRFDVVVVAGLAVTVPIKVDITSIGEPPLAPCNCTPWAGIVGGTVDGVQKVEASGGSYGDCPGTTPTVTITGPGGVTVTNNGGQHGFDPAADGTWIVTSVICGKTNTATITLP